MEKRDLQLKTKRLLISPMSDEEMRQLIIETPIIELKQAYQEMLDGCLKNPEHRLWYTAWKISLKENKQLIGSAGFKGSANKYSVEIGYGIDEEFEGNGYATEATKALIDWAFGQEGIYFIEAETDSDNRASQRILEKLSFKPDGEGEEGPRFVLEKGETSWMEIYMCFGLSIGTALGATMNNMAIGMCFGMAIGMCLGVAIDSASKKKRKEIREEREKQ